MILELLVGNACHVHKNNSRPKEVAKMAPWVMLLAISCQKLQLRIIKSLMKLLSIQYLFHPLYLK
jgi:hypothetical protein